jgi:hypothetical protein
MLCTRTAKHCRNNGCTVDKLYKSYVSGKEVVSCNIFFSGNDSPLKGLCYQLNICLDAYRINSVLSVHSPKFFLKFLVGLFQEKINMMFFIASLKTLLILKFVS